MTPLAPAIIATWRLQLQQRQALLRAEFERDADTARLLRYHCRLVDQLLCDIWLETGLSGELCMVAVGGYGRGELFPHSDVDLLILLPDGHAEEFNSRLEPLIGLFWDIGLAVGHSVRSLGECLDEAAADVTVRTNLLEARWLAGDRHAFQRMRKRLAEAMNATEFLQAKQLEQEQRHMRFNDTAYNLEPNIKESPGGLRDLQNVLWISQGLGLGDNWGALARNGLITAPEARQIRRHELFLQMLRVRLHYLAGRREDRLLFDFQNELAAQLGLAGSSRRRASEQLMQQYYRSAKFVRLMNEILLQNLQERIAEFPQKIIAINPRFQARNGLLEATSSSLLQREPRTILESFLLLEQHPELKGMSAPMLRTLWRVKGLVNREFRRDAGNKRLFLEILRQPAGVTVALRRMNRYGILGRYIPAFGRISGQMQHDLFHVYTVDEHILNVLRNLRRFATPKYGYEFPLCSQLITTFDKPELLYLGALFHDIAKGRGGDHSMLGTADAKRFCKQHGLPRQDIELVAWLVEKHLLMSSTAQKCDLTDPSVIEGFARQMRDEYHLVALYLLTVADIRGTSPAVWNAWKAKLLENLFLATRRLLRGTSISVDAEVAARQQQAAITLSHYAIASDAYQELWNKLGRGYFLRHESQDIAWHTRVLLAHLNSTQPIVRSRLSPGGDGIQVLVYSRDSDDLFARICGFFERINYTIVEARIHTTRHGHALDSFLVLDENEKGVRYRDLLSYIEYELTQRIASPEMPQEPSYGRVSRQLKHFPMQPDISITPEANGQNHLLSITAGDRPGLLSRISHIFLRHGVCLHTAKINTLGNRAEDTFLISGGQGNRLTDSVTQHLKKELSETL
ncbi:MAG TPA: [protein-PII] uridylyltransferase [Methylophilaceae bacterium]|nr:[protein-PII] uridylyltransferase [Methylophilaceae bacterium]